MGCKLLTNLDCSSSSMPGTSSDPSSPSSSLSPPRQLQRRRASTAPVPIATATAAAPMTTGRRMNEAVWQQAVVFCCASDRHERVLTGVIVHTKDALQMPEPRSQEYFAGSPSALSV